MPIAAMMYEPRLMSMYFGQRPAISIPQESEFRTTDICMVTAVSCSNQDAVFFAHRKLRSDQAKASEEYAGSSTRAGAVLLLDRLEQVNWVPDDIIT